MIHHRLSYKIEKQDGRIWWRKGGGASALSPSPLLVQLKAFEKNPVYAPEGGGAEGIIHNNCFLM